MTRSRLLTREYTLRFLVPAFLGNAEQTGEWRTPPLKAQLRQWWRIAVARGHDYNSGRIREAEGRLFGHAWLESDRNSAGQKVSGRRSLVRLRLDSWAEGSLRQVPDIGQIGIGDKSLPAALYSGYGPISKPRRQPETLRGDAAIAAGEHSRLRLAFPEEQQDSIDLALALMHRFGTVGGRSRNGWGSYVLEGSLADTDVPLVEWRSALQRDWAHGIGRDDTGALVWHSKPQARWEDALGLLAQLRADMRRAVSDRLLLAHPNTKSHMDGWDRNTRVPHTMRFKIRQEAKTFVAMVFHVPCRPPDDLWKKLNSGKQKQLEQVFAEAHRFMDGHKAFQREQRS